MSASMSVEGEQWLGLARLRCFMSCTGQKADQPGFLENLGDLVERKGLSFSFSPFTALGRSYQSTSLKFSLLALGAWRPDFSDRLSGAL
jgi:hypothetical protein